MEDPSNESWAKRAIDRWVETAAMMLAAEAKTHIHAEAEVRFRDALAARQAAGESEARAMMAAIQDLGNPHKARWAYARIYLTDSDEAHVRLATQPPSLKSLRSFWSLMWLVMLILITFDYLRNPIFDFPSRVSNLMLFGALSVRILANLFIPLANRLRLRPLRDLAALTFLPDLTLGIWIAFDFWSRPLRNSDPLVFRMFSVVIVLGTLVLSYQMIRLWSKLGRMARHEAQPNPPMALGH